MRGFPHVYRSAEIGVMGFQKPLQKHSKSNQSNFSRNRT